MARNDACAVAAEQDRLRLFGEYFPLEIGPDQEDGYFLCNSSAATQTNHGSPFTWRAKGLIDQTAQIFMGAILRGPSMAGVAGGTKVPKRRYEARRGKY